MPKKFKWISFGRKRIACPRCHKKFDVEGADVGPDDARMALNYEGKRKVLRNPKKSKLHKDMVDFDNIRCLNPKCRVILGVDGDLDTGYLGLRYTTRNERGLK